jgi:adenosylcobinamide kinase/adenosylcobinamide-phosphate guanylyltransferase
MRKTTLILGGARSGKSQYGEKLALKNFGSHIYIFTAQSWDEEMDKRIVIHKERREGTNWQDVESPIELSNAITSHAAEDTTILVDCLTLWVTNLMLADRDIDTVINKLLVTIKNCPGEIILVSNEVGFGIVPENAMARRFRDFSGELHQKLALQAENVLLMVAGIPIVVKE